MLIIPVGDETPRHRQPIVTYMLVAINVLAYFAILIVGEGEPAKLVSKIALMPGSHNVLAAFLSMFIHLNPVIAIFSMLFLGMMGDNVEDELGHFGFLVFYLFCGIGAALLNASIFADFAKFNNPIIGSYEVVGAVIGAYIVFYPHNKMNFVFFRLKGRYERGTAETRAFQLPSWAVPVFWLLINLAGTFFVDQKLYQNILYSLHLPGLFIGAIAMAILAMSGIKKVYWHREKMQSDVEDDGSMIMGLPTDRMTPEQKKFAEYRDRPIHERGLSSGSGNDDDDVFRASL